MKITHYDDGKGRTQSHCVDIDGLVFGISSYGETKEEAYDKAIDKLGKYIEELKRFRSEIINKK